MSSQYPDLQRQRMDQPLYSDVSARAQPVQAQPVMSVNAVQQQQYIGDRKQGIAIAMPAGAAEIPVGQAMDGDGRWGTSLFACFDNCCSCFQTLCCVWSVIARIRASAGISTGSLGQMPGSNYYRNIVFFFCLWAAGFFRGAIGVIAAGFMFAMVWMTRMAFRAKYNIREKSCCCGCDDTCWDDCCTVFWCGCCAIAQMDRVEFQNERRTDCSTAFSNPTPQYTVVDNV